MALIFTDGFDHYNTGTLKWTSSPTMLQGTGRYGIGQYAWQQNAYHVVAASQEHATFIIGVAMRVPAGRTSNLVFKSDNGATNHVTVSCPAGGFITAGRGATTGLGTATYQVVADTWFYLEAKCTLHDSTGSLTVRVNNATVLTLTNIDTKNGGTKTVFDSFGFSFSVDISYIDDMYVCNGDGVGLSDFLGEISIETLLPNAAGTTTQLTSSTGGANYTTVDESPQNTSDYNGSATNDQYDTYNLSNLTISTGTIQAVNVYAYAAKSDAGAKSGAIVIRSGGTDYEQTSFALAASYVYYNTIFETDPATSAAWTITNVNALEAGFKVKA